MTLSLTLAEQIAQNRADRLEIAARVRQCILRGDQSIEVYLPDREPARRDAYRAVNAQAYHLWGAGTYRIARMDGGMILERR